MQSRYTGSASGGNSNNPQHPLELTIHILRRRRKIGQHKIKIKRKYDIWVADVGATPDMSYGMHQYSFRGSVDGIDGNVDLDLAVRDYPDIMRKNRLNGY